MKRHNLTIVMACVTLAYWVPFYVCIFGDLYITWPSGALVLKFLFPVALAANITGVVFGLVFPMKGRFWPIGVVALNAAPPVAAACLLWWLFFGVKI